MQTRSTTAAAAQDSQSPTAQTQSTRISQLEWRVKIIKPLRELRQLAAREGLSEDAAAMTYGLLTSAELAAKEARVRAEVERQVRAATDGAARVRWGPVPQSSDEKECNGDTTPAGARPAPPQRRPAPHLCGACCVCCSQSFWRCSPRRRRLIFS